MEGRPRIKLNLSPLEKNLEKGGFVLLLLMWMFAGYAFLKLPHIIPIHFDAAGNANDYGRKETILLLPLFATVIFFGLTELNKYPHVFNYMVKITDENAERQYGLATKMLRFLKLIILVIFIVIILFIYLAAKGISDGPGIWFLPIMIAVLLIPTFLTIRRSFKEK